MRFSTFCNLSAAGELWEKSESSVDNYDATPGAQSARNGILAVLRACNGKQTRVE
jgi:hypothetical protein